MPSQNEISAEELLRLRLFNQRISSHKEKTPASLIKHFGAMQAQDYPMAKWGIGARLGKTTEKNVQSALDSGKIIRTHVLRPTWHFVSPENLSWMLSLTASRLRASTKARLKFLGITPAIIKKSNKLLEDLLKGKSVSREEIMSAYTKEKIKTSEYRGGHLLFEAEIEGLICNGKYDDGKHTYALFSDRIPETKKLTRSDALKKLAKVYFQSHGPASIPDFTWWSGLSPGDAREAVSMYGDELIRFSYNNTTLYAFKPPAKTPELEGSVYLLPAYDEYTIAYKDRAAMIDKRFLKKTISTNGIFYPLILWEGKIVALWKKQQTDKSLEIEILQFSGLGTEVRKALTNRVSDYENFYGLKTSVKYSKH